MRRAGLIFLAVPDTKMAEIYQDEIGPHLRPGQILLFAHGFAIHYRLIVPPPDVDVVMVAPKGLGPMVRSQFVEGAGVPCALAIAQDATGHARQLAFSYAKAIGGTRAGVFETTFQEETEADLFAEQAVSCGGINALVQAGFETLVEAGYQPETAYFECLHELKFLVDLMHRAGISGMRARISETAKWGDVSVGPEIIGAERQSPDERSASENPARKIRQRVAAGDSDGTRSATSGCSKKGQVQPIEQVGERLRRMMPWLVEKNGD